MLFGDSLIAGYGLPAEDTVPTKLESLLRGKHPGVKIINGGVSGDTTAGGRSRLEWTLDRHEPSLVILALGGNDVLRGIPPAVTRENLTAMLDLLKQREIQTILSAVQAPDSHGATYGEQLEAAYKDLSKDYNIPLYPFLLADVFGNAGLMQPDGIHPNAQGAQRIAQRLAQYLMTLDYFTQKGT